MNLLKYMKLSKRIISLFVFMLLLRISPTVKGQVLEGDSLCSFNVQFVRHLIHKAQYDDALYVLNDTLFKTGCQLFNDDFNYLKGWSYYYKKELDSSCLYLNKVSPLSPLYTKSKFYVLYNNAHLGNYYLADTIARAITDTSELIQQLTNIEMAGISLLKRDFIEFDKFASKFKNDFYYFELQQQELINTKINILKTKRKSKYLAAGLSAIIPGLGKLYGGRPGEGIAAFTMVGGLAAITIESYLKYGIKDYKTIAFGSLFSLFYLGNIYGSMVTVQQYKNDVTQSQNLTILYHMHIPLRTIFE